MNLKSFDGCRWHVTYSRGKPHAPVPILRQARKEGMYSRDKSLGALAS